MSQLVSGKKYKTAEYVFAISISLGMTLFLWSDHTVNAVHSKSGSIGNTSSDHFYGTCDPCSVPDVRLIHVQLAERPLRQIQDVNPANDGCGQLLLGPVDLELAHRTG